MTSSHAAPILFSFCTRGIASCYRDIYNYMYTSALMQAAFGCCILHLLVPKMVLTLCNLRWWCFLPSTNAKYNLHSWWSSSATCTCGGVCGGGGGSVYNTCVCIRACVYMCVCGGGGVGMCVRAVHLWCWCHFLCVCACVCAWGEQTTNKKKK